MEVDLVSIIMPCFNSERHVRESINSVINQTYKNWELIIIDDASNDSTVEIVKNIFNNDSRLKLIQNESHNGAAISRNIGINAAKGSYVAFLDSDDLWKKNKLQKQISFMQENNYFFTYTYYDNFNEVGDLRLVKCPKSLNRMTMIFMNPIGALTVIYNKAELGNINIKHIKKRNDYALWLEILKKSKSAHNLPESLGLYRESKNGLSGGSRLKQIFYYWQVLRLSFKYWLLLIPLSTPIYLIILFFKKQLLWLYNLLIIRI